MQRLKESKRAGDALHSLLSFLPEDKIIYGLTDLRSRESLAFKYEAQSTPPNTRSARMLALAAFVGLAPLPTAAGTFTILGKNACVETECPSPVTAHDPETGVTLELGSLDATFIHTDGMKGLEDAKLQLAAIAEYIANTPDIRKAPIVAGTTYSELARFGTRMGMRAMEITEADRKLEIYLRASHAWTFAGSERPREFKMAAVYLPTEEFIERFSKEHLETSKRD